MCDRVAQQIKLTRWYYTAVERPDDLLCNQLQKAATIVDRLVFRPLIEFQTDALICLLSDLLFDYAESPSVKFPDSFLLKAVNRGMFQIAAAEFHQFCFVKGRVDTRAWNKRTAEQLLFSRGILMFP